MNNQIEITKNIARRNLDRAESALSQALLGVRDITPQQIVVCQFSGKSVPTECQAWQDFYYSPHTAKKAEAFRKGCPGAAVRIEGTIQAFFAADAAYKAARDAAKKALEARRAAKAAIATERSTQAKERPLASVNPQAAANYDILSATFSAARADFIAHYVALWLDQANRRLAGRVERNLDVAHETSNATHAAGHDFDSYLAKLATKIEARIISASLTGRGLWTGSTLTVDVEPAGQTVISTPQVWYTKQILNVSVLGKLFNQWPTRRVS